MFQNTLSGKNGLRLRPAHPESRFFWFSSTFFIIWRSYTTSTYKFLSESPVALESQSRFSAATLRKCRTPIPVLQNPVYHTLKSTTFHRIFSGNFQRVLKYLQDFYRIFYENIQISGFLSTCKSTWWSTLPIYGGSLTGVSLRGDVVRGVLEQHYCWCW